ncbi:uncharacterized protein LOC128393680 [Panonychus citri]|uniref:uncharacterized protein LOC128393680 n=1 Tax=Panonychus citri TaxID=50023 RepID=UPI002306F56E|nr:uncharacterized protein LOC128393680 [Panonychus citri]
MAGRKIFFDNFVSKNALRLPRKGSDPNLADLYNNAKRINLKRIERIQANLDPFYPNIASFREMIQFLSNKRIRKTNEECILKTNIVNSGNEPELQFFLKNGKKLVYKTGLLQTIDILYHLNSKLAEVEADFSEE